MMGWRVYIIVMGEERKEEERKEGERKRGRRGRGRRGRRGGMKVIYSQHTFCRLALQNFEGIFIQFICKGHLCTLS